MPLKAKKPTTSTKTSSTNNNHRFNNMVYISEAENKNIQPKTTYVVITLPEE